MHAAPSRPPIGSPRATGPPWSTPTASTCARVAQPSPPSPSPTSCTKSGNWATPAAPTCWSAISTRAAPKATAPSPPRAALPDSCSPTPTTCATKDTELLGLLAAACPEMTQLTTLIRDFAALLTPASGNDAQAHRMDHPGPRRRPAPPAQLLQRPRTRPCRRQRRPDPPMEQRPHRRRQHPHQTDHAADARPCRIRPPPPPHPAEHIRHPTSPPTTEQSPLPCVSDGLAGCWSGPS